MIAWGRLGGTPPVSAFIRAFSLLSRKRNLSMRFFFRRSGVEEKSIGATGLTTLELATNEAQLEQKPSDTILRSEKSHDLESVSRTASFSPEKRLVPASELP